MGRSAKEYCRPDQVIDGGGDVHQNMASGQKVVPKGEDSGSGKKRAEERKKKKPSTQQPSAQQKALDDMMEAESGWDQIGKAGASIVSTYKAKKAAK